MIDDILNEIEKHNLLNLIKKLNMLQDNWSNYAYYENISEDQLRFKSHIGIEMGVLIEILSRTEKCLGNVKYDLNQFLKIKNKEFNND